jgi:hypothetical protein
MRTLEKQQILFGVAFIALCRLRCIDREPNENRHATDMLRLDLNAEMAGQNILESWERAIIGSLVDEWRRLEAVGDCIDDGMSFADFMCGLEARKIVARIAQPRRVSMNGAQNGF